MNFNKAKEGNVFSNNGKKYLTKKSKGCICGNGTEICVAKNGTISDCLSFPLCSKRGVDLYFIELTNNGNKSE